ncbi:MAG TPA: hypothetical protein PKD09_00355 [Aggregatilinea sp.]|uniref:hypothetical protein n=1 Tax=Aggregatilinea sp. TaxID=2806333 RepID=UPI002C93AFF6|nr:hypothetical protein [Aggregatilinea sp.]HML20066.1 hypothetical protein [Aggregatilinea sp.]
MKRRTIYAIAVIISLGTLWGSGRNARAQSPDGELTAVITSPTDGQQLFGMVSISGSARHSGAFASYTLEYDDLSDPAEQWIPVQERVTQQVDNGVLGAWNTNLVPDGTYQLRLSVTLTTGDIGEYVVRGLRVINSAPTPVPTVPGSGLAATPLAITPGPSPTSPVEQPPSNNPNDGGAAGIVVENGQAAAPSLLDDNEPQAKTTVNVGRVQDAFCTGAIIGGGVFMLVLLYAVLHRRFRSSVQDPAWPQRDSSHRPY